MFSESRDRLNFNVLPAPIQTLIRLAVLEDDEAAALHLDEVLFRRDDHVKLTALILAYKLIHIKNRRNS